MIRVPGVFRVIGVDEKSEQEIFSTTLLCIDKKDIIKNENLNGNNRNLLKYCFYYSKS